jgi:class 3 adenylate cyclase
MDAAATHFRTMPVRRSPETEFARNGQDALAYQVVGDNGGDDLLFLPGWISNVELNWDELSVARFLRNLARGRRLVVTDPRGVGCSERSSAREPWPLEMYVDDVGVVLDAVGSERATIMASQECAFAACMFAATYPERTSGLILYEASARWLWSPETPWEWTSERWEEAYDRSGTWSRSEAAGAVRDHAPSMAENEGYVEWWYRYCLLSAAPGYNRAAGVRYRDTDVRAILPAIHVPVLVLVRAEHPDPSWKPSGAHLAGLIAGARLVELPGRDASLWLGDQDVLLTAIDHFFDDMRREQGELDRVLATVLVTDIVESTSLVARIGDAAWKDLIQRHHALVRALLARFRGTEVDTAGDGFLATFEGPARAIDCAHAVVQSIRALGIEVRAGIHTGECEVADGKLAGIAVNIAARIAGLAGASEVLVSQTVRDLVAGSRIEFESRGSHRLKGVAERWRLYRAVRS